MELTIHELKSLRDDDQEKLQQIYDLQHRLDAANETIKTQCAELEYWKGKAMEYQQQAESSVIENTMLKTYIVLSIEKVRAFFGHVTDMTVHSLLYTFVTMTMPEKYVSMLSPVINELAPVPDGKSHGDNYFNGNVGQVIGNANEIKIQS